MSKTSVVHDIVAGGIGGCAGIVVGHPMDTVKVQIQTQEFGGKYTSLLECIRTVQSQKLSKGYFRGLSWPFMSYGFINAIFFGTYGHTLKAMDYEETKDGKPLYGHIGFASAVATLPQLLVMCPVEVIKVTLQSQIPHSKAGSTGPAKKYYSGPLEAAASIFKQSGLKGLYRGILTQVVRDTPASVMYMVSYAFFQQKSKENLPSIPSQVVNFIGGGVAGVLSWLIIMPFDVIKSKLQADTERKLYKGFWQCARSVYSTGGIHAFFLGLTPMAVRAFPVNAVTLMMYTESLIYLDKWNS